MLLVFPLVSFPSHACVAVPAGVCVMIPPLLVWNALVRCRSSSAPGTLLCVESGICFASVYVSASQVDKDRVRLDPHRFSRCIARILVVSCDG